MTRDWDERFRRTLAEGAAPDPPAAWLLEHCEVFAARVPGRACDVACGLGRHALWLAELGFEVDAVDGSAVALAKVVRLAGARGLPIVTERVDLRRSPALPRPPYGAVIVTNYLQRDLLPVLVAALEPGGVLAIEAFLADRDPEWGPSDPEFVLAPGELEHELLAEMEVMFSEEAPHRGRVKARALAVTPLRSGSDG